MSEYTVRLLGGNGEEEYTMKAFVELLKVLAGEGKIQIHGYGLPVTTVLGFDTGSYGGAPIVFQGEKERAFWNAMDLYGWPSGQNPYRFHGMRPVAPSATVAPEL